MSHSSASLTNAQQKRSVEQKLSQMNHLVQKTSRLQTGLVVAVSALVLILLITCIKYAKKLKSLKLESNSQSPTLHHIIRETIVESDSQVTAQEGESMSTTQIPTKVEHDGKTNSLDEVNIVVNDQQRDHKTDDGFDLEIVDKVIHDELKPSFRMETKGRN